MVGFEAEQAILPDLHDAFRAGVKPDHERPFELLDAPRHWDVTHQRHISGLHPAIREIDRGRGLGGSRDSHEHDVGFLEPFEMLSVVMEHRVVERIDALEIFGIERVLGADAVRRFGAEIGL